ERYLPIGPLPGRLDCQLLLLADQVLEARRGQGQRHVAALDPQPDLLGSLPDVVIAGAAIAGDGGGEATGQRPGLLGALQGPEVGAAVSTRGRDHATSASRSGSGAPPCLSAWYSPAILPTWLAKSVMVTIRRGQ